MTLSHSRFSIRTALVCDDVSRVAAEWHPHLALVEKESGGEAIL
jgi:hypothetical protein